MIELDLYNFILTYILATTCVFDTLIGLSFPQMQGCSNNPFKVFN